MRALTIATTLAVLVGPAAAQTPAGRTVWPRRVSPVAVLHARLPEITLDQAPLSEALRLLADMAAVNLYVRWERLAEVGVQHDTPVTVRARNLRVSQVLWIVLNEAAPDGPRLGYRLDADLLTVTTAADLGEELLVRVYDVRDLIMPEIANPSISFGRQRTYVQTVIPTVFEGAVAVQPVTGILDSGVRFEGRNDGGTIFINRQGGGEQDVGAASDERMRRLIETITATIEPDTWRVNGGRGTIEPFNGLLVIRASPLVHQQIGGAVRR